MAIINKEQLLARNKRRYREIQYEGDTYRIQSLTEGERTDYELLLQSPTGGLDLQESRRLLIAKTLVDADGKRLVEDDESPALAELDGKLMGILYRAAERHCGYDVAEIEGVIKNSVKVSGSA